jgi:alkylation response protein AidB-like acyl-CoA dehydrogenase
MDFDLSEEQSRIRNVSRDFAARELEPVAAKLDREGDRDTFVANLRKLAELGLMGINVRSEYGGAEAGAVAFSLAITEIARACASTAVTLSVNNMVCEVIQSVGSSEQKKRYIPAICSGEHLAGAFALTEPGAGSDAASIRTTAVLDRDEWILNGSKIFITSGEYADLFVVWAVTDPSLPKGEGMSTFLVDSGTKGISVGRAERKMGQRASATNPITFEDCRVPKTALLGDPNAGFKLATDELAGGRIGIGSLGLGVGLAALELATQYALDRRQFDQPISNFQAIQWMIAESHTELQAARWLLLNAAFLKECGRPFARQASMAKYFATEAAERACSRAMQMLGGYGYTQEYPIERYYRDVRVTSIYEGTNEVQRLIIAHDVLRASAH